MRDKHDFFHERKHRIFLQANSIVFIDHSHVRQNYPNIKFVIYLQYLKKEGRDEVDLLHENKHQIFKLFKLLLLILVGMAMPNLLLPPY